MLENNIENNNVNSKNIDGITHETLDKYFESESKDEGISWDELSESLSTWIEDTKNSTIEGLVSVLPVSIIQLLANHGLLDNIDRADSTALAEIEIEKWQQINTNEIPTESISGIPDILIKNMSIDQLSNLSSEQIKFLSPTQVSELSSEQLSSLGEKILSLSDINIKSLTSEQLQGLAETGNLQFINPNMISTESLKGWDDYSNLPKEYISHIPVEEFKTIDLSSFTIEKINLFSTEQFQNITITNLTPEQLQGLSKELTLTLSNTDIQNLLEEGKLSNINPASISPGGLQGLNDYSSLPPEYIQYLQM